jgi:hypothetical protein
LILTFENRIFWSSTTYYILEVGISLSVFFRLFFHMDSKYLIKMSIINY